MARAVIAAPSPVRYRTSSYRSPGCSASRCAGESRARSPRTAIQKRPRRRMEAVSESRNSGTRAPLWRVREIETFAERCLRKNQPAVSPMIKPDLDNMKAGMFGSDLDLQGAPPSRPAAAPSNFIRGELLDGTVHRTACAERQYRSSGCAPEVERSWNTNPRRRRNRRSNGRPNTGTRHDSRSKRHQDSRRPAGKRSGSRRLRHERAGWEHIPRE